VTACRAITYPIDGKRKDTSDVISSSVTASCKGVLRRVTNVSPDSTELAICRRTEFILAVKSFRYWLSADDFAPTMTSVRQMWAARVRLYPPTVHEPINFCGGILSVNLRISVKLFSDSSILWSRRRRHFKQVSAECGSIVRFVFLQYYSLHVTYILTTTVSLTLMELPGPFIPWLIKWYICTLIGPFIPWLIQWYISALISALLCLETNRPSLNLNKHMCICVYICMWMCTLFI